MYKNLFSSSHLQDTNLRDTLLGRKVVSNKDKEHKLFHNTFELHDFIYDVIKLSGNTQDFEIKSLDSNSKSSEKRYVAITLIHNFISSQV